MNNGLRIILVAVGIILVVMIGVVVHYLHNISADIHSIHKQEPHYVYEWREVSTFRFTDEYKSSKINYYEKYKKKEMPDWEEKAWEEIRSIDLDGWEYAGTLLSSEESIIILVKRRIADV